MKRVLPIVIAGWLAASAVATAMVEAVPATGAPVTASAATGGRYVPLVTPQRALDSRLTGGPLGQGETRSLNLSGLVPATAIAVVLNLTATAPTQPGYLTVWPTGSPQPTTSSLNKRAGETRSNSVTVAMPTDSAAARSVNIFNQAGTTQVVVDVSGYYDVAPSSTGRSYYPLAEPERVYDSRDGGESGGVFAPGDSVVLGAPLQLQNLSAVAVTITAVTPDGPGYLTAWEGSGRPGTSTVNYEAGRVTPNFAVVPVTQRIDPSDNSVFWGFTVANNISDTDVVVDVVGEYATAGQNFVSGSYLPVVPQRLSDTRQTGALGPKSVYDTGVPGGAEAFAANLNMTAVSPTAGTFLTVYSTDAAAKPFVSNLNAAPRDVVPNAVQTLLSAAGLYRVYNASGYVNVVADLQGVFVRDPLATGRVAAPANVATRFTAIRH